MIFCVAGTEEEYLGNNPDAATDDGGLSLGARHAAEPAGEEDATRQVRRAELKAPGVEHGEGCAVYDTLGACTALISGTDYRSVVPM